jgi:hypothetical protein
MDLPESREMADFPGMSSSGDIRIAYGVEFDREPVVFL